MQISIEYDVELDVDQVSVGATDLTLLGTEPHSIETGAAEGPIAYYVFPEDTSEADVEEALEQSSWCYKSMTRLDISPTP